MGKPENGCSIYVVFGDRKVRIPVNPEELEIKYPTANKTYDVLGVGQVVVPGKPALRQISWEGFFPGDPDAPYVNRGARPPKDYVDAFERALKNKQQCRLIISRSGLYDTNMKCVVSNFETRDKGGEPEDIYYSLELLEYRSYTPRTITIMTAQTVSQEPVQAVTETAARPIETPILRVGASVTVNGPYCYDSYGARPHGTANNLSTTVTRIVSGNPYPIHVGSYGWVQESQLQITG